MLRLTQQVLPLILKWEWGTTSNFLYQFPGEETTPLFCWFYPHVGDPSQTCSNSCCRADSAVPPCLRSEESFQLIDGGLLINVGYPPFLGDKRDVDLIIAPEYSAGELFEVL